MYSLNNNYVLKSDTIGVEIFLNICEEQGIRWYTGETAKEGLSTCAAESKIFCVLYGEIFEVSSIPTGFEYFLKE
jgi:hypothetical protein